MNAKPRTARRAGRFLTAATVVGAALLTSACANGKQAQTANEKPTLDGTNIDVGTVSLRGLAIVSPPLGKYSAGDNPPLRVVIVNRGGQADTLTSISSPDFGGWGTFASSDAANAFIAAQQRGAGASTSSAAAPGTSTAPTASATPLPLGQQKVPVGPGTSVSFGQAVTPGILLLEDLKKKTLYPAETVELKFTFDKAGSVSVRVPVELSRSGGSESVPAESTSPSSVTGG